jgi:hypothetical protein
VADNSKGTSLLHYGMNYGCKKFYDTGPWLTKAALDMVPKAREPKPCLMRLNKNNNDDDDEAASQSVHQKSNWSDGKQGDLILFVRNLTKYSSARNLTKFKLIEI